MTTNLILTPRVAVKILGQQAKKNGRPRIPSEDKTFAKIIKEAKNYEIIELLQGWTWGYDHATSEIGAKE